MSYINEIKIAELFIDEIKKPISQDNYEFSLRYNDKLSIPAKWFYAGYIAGIKEGKQCE